MDHCFKWPAHRAIEHIAAAKLNRIPDILTLGRLFVAAFGQNMTNHALCRPSPRPMLAEWSQLVGPATGLFEKRTRRTVGQKSQQIGIVLWRRPRPAASDIRLGKGAWACNQILQFWCFRLLVQ